MDGADVLWDVATGKEIATLRGHERKVSWATFSPGGRTVVTTSFDDTARNLRRRAGFEPVTYPSEAVRAVLGRTLGVPLFQEQVIKLAMVAAGFSAGEADRLRRSMATWRQSGGIEDFEGRLIEGMRQRGYPETYARRICEQIRGFGEYGFPESHAASFALLAYCSAWLKCHEPAAAPKNARSQAADPYA